MPRAMLMWVGRRMGDGLWLSRIRQRVVRQNLEFVGQLPPEQRPPMIHALCRNMGCYMVDVLRSPVEIAHYHDEGEITIEGLRNSTRGTLIVFSHLGNWELLLSVLATKLDNLAVVAKAMKNPLVDDWLRERRQRCGWRILPPDNVVRRAKRIITDGGAVAIAIDQWPGDTGSPSEFLGRMTRTARSAAGLALMTGCRVVAAHAILEADGRYRIRLQDLAWRSELPADRRESVELLQAHHNREISAIIAAQPEHWFGWFHRRFKDGIAY